MYFLNIYLCLFRLNERFLMAPKGSKKTPVSATFAAGGSINSKANPTEQEVASTMVGLVETEIATIAGAEIDKVTPVKGKGSKTSGFKKPKSGEGKKLNRNMKPKKEVANSEFKEEILELALKSGKVVLKPFDFYLYLREKSVKGLCCLKLL
ncbi:uncharacterized protein LOC112092364 [Morus notabilis]|uniref:uncharacterized protein LOC112092364 n=1 Tax=Morus notabilis TaxID=981085 RepID=UPI000CED6343|nr:uncharacterized protein LOC112092364 [Morus notabilis]